MFGWLPGFSRPGPGANGPSDRTGGSPAAGLGTPPPADSAGAAEAGSHDSPDTAPAESTAATPEEPAAAARGGLDDQHSSPESATNARAGPGQDPDGGRADHGTKLAADPLRPSWWPPGMGEAAWGAALAAESQKYGREKLHEAKLVAQTPCLLEGMIRLPYAVSSRGFDGFGLCVTLYYLNKLKSSLFQLS